MHINPNRRLQKVVSLLFVIAKKVPDTEAHLKFDILQLNFLLFQLLNSNAQYKSAKGQTTLSRSPRARSDQGSNTVRIRSNSRDSVSRCSTKKSEIFCYDDRATRSYPLPKRSSSYATIAQLELILCLNALRVMRRSRNSNLLLAKI